MKFTEFGNLVLFDPKNSAVWQSFDHPTDSLLVGRTLFPDQKLTSSTSASNWTTECKLEWELIPAASSSSSQFIRLDPDGHLKAYEWTEWNWNAVADLLTLSMVNGCLLLYEVFSLVNNDGGLYNITVFLKVQKSPTAEYLTPSPTYSPQKQSRHVKIILGSSLGAFFSVLFVVAFYFFLFRNKGESDELDEFFVDQVPGMPIRFSYEGLSVMTSNFNNKLGEGGFGLVFQETLNDGTKIVVKHLNGFGQVKKSFLVEVEPIGSTHHVNLVGLIGFCAKKSYKLLVYEYMSNECLDTWIFHRHQELTLGWQSRKKIIMDIANRLTYLHEDCRQKILHLDIKPQNILLDEYFNVKIADFGLSKLIDKDQSQVVTVMRGTLGYLAPE
ncbi:hypothetical protein TEA_019771 [Camellia sinensis var. sinensis]|uniref:non-specific serine/threonine protein kinase n=1 Tax=Camellia sinensis var. sinensis TaxID=542762 RepID=A0A4S4EI62_CAMSN|nr:hypothetical protein TEA_019771 [Camellia sinensis var. sinensis]